MSLSVLFWWDSPFKPSACCPPPPLLSFIFYSLSCLWPTWVPPGACKCTSAISGTVFLSRYESVHVRVIPSSGSCGNVKYDVHIFGQRILSICSASWRKVISQTNSPAGRQLPGFRVNPAFQSVPKERRGRMMETRRSGVEHEALWSLRTCNILVSSPLKLIYLYWGKM